MENDMSNRPSIIVPARLESTRFPRKLLHQVRGKPILLWTAERIRAEAPEFPLYFAVDDPSLADCLEAAGFESILTKVDHVCGTDRLAEANARIGAASVINVQGDEPLVTGAQIRALAEGLQHDVAIATLAVPFQEPADFADPNQVKVVRARNGHALCFSRSPIPFARASGGAVDASSLAQNTCLRHLGLYAYDADFLARFGRLEPGFLEQVEQLEQLRALEHGYRIHVGLTHESTIGIDTPEDAIAFEAALPA
jgi:3-deoxy-manno-octulosonate cytidylyltransferase (CMP-KDO synthetase)|tara:strand:+ start:1152 stop:1913 length:762 start_codon:yes stop_codon:yes gene_type:complete